MTGKILGAILVIMGCGSFGFALSANVMREELALRQLIGALDYMQCELQYRMTPLPDLCRQVGLQQKNRIGYLFTRLSTELEENVSPDVFQCVCVSIEETPGLPKQCVKAVELLGASLGRFDIPGQIQGLESVRLYCRNQLETIAQNRDERLRSYQTLGICTGAALAILFV